MKKYLLLLVFFVASIAVKAQTRPDTIIRDKQVFTAVQFTPEFPGGEEALGKFLQANIRYPKADKKNNVQGKVYIQFVVERDGSLTDFMIIRAPTEAMGVEVQRVLSLSPNWKPGIQNDKPVRVQYTLPVNFSLSK